MKRSGFTLVELSIVLVVIGLIIGGILASQEMVRGSELNRVLADKDRISAAINTFRTKYSALPGDMRNATDFWGTASGGCPNGTRTGTQTCNGNGDGTIGGASTGSTWDTTQPSFIEAYLAMQHMALAGLLQGSYSGYVSAGNYSAAQIGFNSPVTSIQGGTFMLFGMLAGHSDFFGAVPRNALFFGATYFGTNVAAFPLLKGSEAQSLDAKVDDGKPGTGSVVTTTSTSAYSIATGGTCATTAVASTALYNSAGSGPICALMFNRR